MKKISKALRAFVDKARASDSYWIEAAKLHFAVSLDRQRSAAGLTYKDVADKLGTSAAYISKVFRGDSNVTIETMVKLARATGGRLDIQVVDGQAEQFSWADCVSALEQRHGRPSTSTQTTATIIDFPAPINDEAFEYRWAA
jgi:transcriptional regulator with XRE-family HTH domain